jgi:hypothetical protein
MRPDIERKAEMLKDDAREIYTLFNYSEKVVAANKARARVTLECIIEAANDLLKELEEV